MELRMNSGLLEVREELSGFSHKMKPLVDFYEVLEREGEFLKGGLVGCMLKRVKKEVPTRQELEIFKRQCVSVSQFVPVEEKLRKLEGQAVMTRDQIDDVDLRLKRQESLATDLKRVMQTKAGVDQLKWLEQQLTDYVRVIEFNDLFLTVLTSRD